MYSYCYNEIIVPKKKKESEASQPPNSHRKSTLYHVKLKENRESIKRELKGALTL